MLSCVYLWMCVYLFICFHKNKSICIFGKPVCVYECTQARLRTFKVYSHCTVNSISFMNKNASIDQLVKIMIIMCRCVHLCKVTFAWKSQQCHRSNKIWSNDNDLIFYSTCFAFASILQNVKKAKLECTYYY